MEINLISDTVTKPSQEMLKYMMSCNVGDDVFKEDPTVNKLEKKVAKMFNMDKALFFPSGTMANQTAIKINTNPGDQLICSKMARVYNYEGGGVSFNSGVSCKLIDKERGLFDAQDVLKSINPADFYHSPRTGLVCIENTTNKGGGACWDMKDLREISDLCRQNHLKYHLDGARIWNASVKKGIDLSLFGELFDTISVCLSKGLGCPVGSLLLCSEQDFNKAIKYRKIFGGGMRQSGYLAACGLFALENNIERLIEDHKKAKEIEEVLKSLYFVKNVEEVETNIIIFEINSDYSIETFINKLQKKGVKLIGMGDGKLRLVTHLNYSDVHHEAFINILSRLTI